MKIIKVIPIIIFIFGVSFADEYSAKINKGFEEYKNGQFDKAIENFKQAGILKPDKPLPPFNKGTAFYKSKDFEQAAKDFETVAAKITDKDLKADAYYNLGNTYFRSNDYKSAVDSYINALKINPGDEDSKHNLEMALRQQQQQQNQGNSGDQKQDKENQNQENQAEKNDKEQKAEDSPQQDSESKEDQQKQTADLKEGQMSKEQAENLLAQFADDEKETQKKLRQMKVRSGSRNDW